MANKGEELGDRQGTKSGAADKDRGASPAAHTDGPSDRPDRTTGAGREATVSDAESELHQNEHRSGYGGNGGSPDTSSDGR